MTQTNTRRQIVNDVPPFCSWKCACCRKTLRSKPTLRIELREYLRFNKISVMNSQIMKNASIFKTSLLVLPVFISFISLIPTSLEQDTSLLESHIFSTNSTNVSVGVIDKVTVTEPNFTKVVIPKPDLSVIVLTPWYRMHLNSEQIQVNMTVTNHLNTAHTYYLIERVTSSNYAHTSSDSITVNPISNYTIPYIQQFDVGQWKLSVQLLYSNNGTVVNNKEVYFVVQPVQDYIILSGVIISAIIGLLTVGALASSVFFSSKQVKTSALFKVFDLLSTPDVRRARTAIHKEYRRQKKLGIKEIRFKNTEESPHLEDDVDLVLSSFDQASIIVINKLLDEESFFDAYGEMIVREWKTLKTEILERQSKNSRTLKHFTNLKEQFEAREDIGNTEPYYDIEEEPHAD